MKKQILSVCTALLIACGAASQVPKTAADGTHCVSDIIADVGGALITVEDAQAHRAGLHERHDARVVVRDDVEQRGDERDIPQTLIDCGITIDDLINIVETWISGNQGDASSDAQISPQMQRAHQLLAAAKAYKAAHP